ncbi:MAG: cytochrome C oxidase subunit IV family protein, partial [Bacteroidota bacterium]
MSHHHEPEIKVLPPDTAKIKKLWMTALYLLLITMVEFIFAFTMDHGPTKTFIFVSLTIVKAGYIVGEFMHLRYEVKVLFWSVLLPMIFIGWMLVAFVYEGTKIVRI